MGDVKSVQYSGSGAVFTLGQSVSADRLGHAWRSRASRARGLRQAGLAQRRSGAARPVPTQFFVGDKAWGQAGSNVTPAAPAVIAERQLQIWLTPHGFLKGALANKATVKGGKVTPVTFRAGQTQNRWHDFRRSSG